MLPEEHRCAGDGFPGRRLLCDTWFDSGYPFFLRQSAASYFGAMLGSSGYNVATVFVFQRNAWFDCGYIFCDSLRSYFSAMLGSTAVTCLRQSKCVFQRNAWFDSGYMVCVSLRAYFSAMLGSTADTWFPSVVFGGFLTDFPRFLREGRPRFLKSMLCHFSRLEEVCTVNASDA